MPDTETSALEFTLLTPEKIIALARTFGGEGITTLIYLARTARSEHVRMSATRELMLRAYGRPGRAAVEPAEVHHADVLPKAPPQPRAEPVSSPSKAETVTPPRAATPPERAAVPSVILGVEPNSPAAPTRKREHALLGPRVPLITALKTSTANGVARPSVPT